MTIEAEAHFDECDEHLSPNTFKLKLMPQYFQPSIAIWVIFFYFKFAEKKDFYCFWLHLSRLIIIACQKNIISWLLIIEIINWPPPFSSFMSIIRKRNSNKPRIIAGVYRILLNIVNFSINLLSPSLIWWCIWLF